MFVILFCFVLTSILVFVPRDENKPPTEDPIAEEPVKPAEPVKPVEPDKPDPTKPKMKLLSFSEKGEAEPSKIEIDPKVGAGALLFCKLPPGTNIIFDLGTEAKLREGAFLPVGKPEKEPGLCVQNEVYEIILLGVTPTAELRAQLDETYDAASGKTSVKIESGTILGTVGPSSPSPFKNDWGVEGCNLIIGIGIYSDHIDLIELSVASILEAITR